MNPIVKILIERDGWEEEEAKDMLEEAKLLVKSGEDPEEILKEEFGLEPDYLLDLIED